MPPSIAEPSLVADSAGVVHDSAPFVAARSPDFLRAALDGLAAQTVVIHRSGGIVAANSAWQAFAARNGADPTAVSEGANYLEACDRAALHGARDAIEAAQGVRDIIAGARENFEMEYPCHSPEEERWFEMRAKAFSFEGDTWLTITHANITRRKRAEISEHLLARELQHRVNNNLAVASAIVSMTARGSDSLENFERACRSRLMALSVANRRLDQEGRGDADLREMIAWATAPFRVDEDRFRIEGPPARLRPSVAMHLTLILHELGTNAAKHGALSVDAGIVAITWHETGGRLHLRWQESGGPRVKRPRRRGFGAALIPSVANAIGATVSVAFQERGLAFNMTLPSATALR